MLIQVRTATSQDIDSIQCIGINVWTETYAERGLTAEIASYVTEKFSRASVESQLADPANEIQVATVLDHVIGYGLRKNNSPCPANEGLTSELATLYVLRRFQGVGVGRALLASLTSTKSLPASPTSLWLRMNSRNQQAFAFYKTAGYHKIGSVWVNFDGEKNENYILAAGDA
ncbi:MAG: GNAT family N-acetyltransferase [Betaproteobacteria bacterium]